MTNETADDSAGKARTEENIEFGARLRQHRQALDLTLDAMSRLTKLVDPVGAGISRVALSRYENGDSLPGLRELKLLSQSLRLPLSYLVYGDPDDPMNFMNAEPLEIAVENFIGNIVNATLRRHQLIPEDEAENIRLSVRDRKSVV